MIIDSIQIVFFSLKKWHYFVIILAKGSIKKSKLLQKYVN